MFRTYLTTLLLLICSVKPLVAEEKTQINQETARERLLMLFSGEWVSRSLYVVAKLEIADHLSQPKTIEELANLTASDPDSLYRLMHMLAGFNIFEEVSPRIFANTETSRLLMKTNPDTLHALSLFYGEDIHKSWDGVLESIQSGVPAFQLTYKQPVFKYFKENPSRAALFQEAMKEKSKAVIKSAILSYDFSKFQSVYDIGGGYGQFMQALLNAHPHLSGTLFELPEIVEKIKQSPQSNDKFKLQSGDFFASVPEGGDAYLLKSVLHDWDDEKAEQLLKNCHQAMGSNSRLLIVEVVLQPKDKSIYANCMDVLMLTITGGKERDLSSFKKMLTNAGFVLENIYPTTTEFSILEARKI
jgi:hypothetical protein